jgi:Stress responsive A/B Barrel Domain
MIHHLKLIHLKPGLPKERVEEVMVESRIRILKIQDVLSLACGKKIPGKEETLHDLFLALEFENSLKRTAAFDHPLYQQFEAQVLKPNAQKIEVLEFEMDPGKDVRFS